MNINYQSDTWRCVLCDRGGGMLDLYVGIFGGSYRSAYEEICFSLGIKNPKPPRKNKAVVKRPIVFHQEVIQVGQSKRASQEEAHKTLTALLSLLTLCDRHRAQLRDRGLTDYQIDQFGFKSTPPPFLCRPLTERLLRMGYTVQGVPGFYLDKDDKWSVKFTARASGIMVPARSIAGYLQSVQIRLDRPFKDQGDSEKKGSKYIWLSSSSEKMGTSVDFPAYIAGDPTARVVYITEGFLKSYVAHCLSDRTFATVGGANNTALLEKLIAFLANNGATEEIIEAMDMDKFKNKSVAAGAAAVKALAHKYGLGFRQMVWAPQFNGIDDWLLGCRQGKAESRPAA